MSFRFVPSHPRLFVCPSDPAAAFLPLGLSSKRAPFFPLALVDSDISPELAALDWTVSRTGHVSRLFHDSLLTKAEGRRVKVTETLGRRILGASDWQAVETESGDPLDLRRKNLRVVVTAGESRTRWAEPGQTARERPDFSAAVAWSLSIKSGRRTRKGRRNTALSDEQVRRFLDALLADPVLAGRSSRHLLEYLHSEYLSSGGAMWTSQVRRILAGKQQPQPGFDYAALAALLPGRAAKFERRERARQGALEFERQARETRLATPLPAAAAA